MDEVQRTIDDISEKAKTASRTLQALSTKKKNTALARMTTLLLDNKEYIQKENEKDINAGKATGLSQAMLDRLMLSDDVISAMITGIHEVIDLPDPVGKIDGMQRRPNGLLVGRMAAPLGVIAMIYESRPNVTVDAAVLCVKAGNSIILRGGSEAFYSNRALAEIMQKALLDEDIAKEAIQVVPVTDREAVNLLLRQEEYIDLIIPRGGEGLIRFVCENSSIPVLKHYKGVCHIYVDKNVDIENGLAIIVNAKTQRPGVCNALEGALIHEDIADTFLAALTPLLVKEGVQLLGCPKSTALADDIAAAQESDWGREFLDLAMCVKVVSGYEQAKQYIEKYGSQHTECILTQDYSLAHRFVQEIDASAVMVNASTRFNDGGELGLGAEIGISTTKLHAYGPMGLEELTTRKFVVFGEGQVRS